MSEKRWLKVELRKSYVTPLGIKEESQTLDRRELEEEQRNRIRTARENTEGLSSQQRRQLLEGLPNPDEFVLDDFEARVLKVAQQYAASPVVEEAGDRMVNIYPAAQVLRVVIDVLEVEGEGFGVIDDDRR